MIARGAAVVVVSIAVVVASCARAPAYFPTQLSSAQVVAAGSPELRTLDDTGFVYPGGNTTEVSQGIGPAVVGRGGYLTPPPRGRERAAPLPLPPVSGRIAGASTSTPAGSDPTEAVARVARALCDHETYCEHIGPSGVFESADACSTEQRARLGNVVAKPGCASATAVRGDLLAACLRKIRAAVCTVDADAFSMPPPCDQALPSC